MSILVDTNILCRVVQREHPQHEEARQAIDLCIQHREVLLLTPQVQREFWVVATRPTQHNGLGLTPTEAAEYLRAFEQFCSFVPDTPAVHQNWQRLVVEHQVCGKPAHDAALVAAMQAHGVDRLLTFNAEHFQRYQNQIALLTPDQLLKARQLELDREIQRSRDPGIER